MSLLSLVQDAMVLCGFESPSAVYSSSDPTVSQFKTLSQVEGDILSRRYDWRRLKVLDDYTGDGTTTTFSLPTDFDRFVTGFPFFLDESPQLPLEMVTDDRMLALKVAQTNPTRPVWRLFGNSVEFYPAPETTDVIKFEYRSKYWIVEETETTSKARWTADTDVAVIPERLITLGLVWRYKKSKGFEYGEDFRTYELEVTKAGSVDGGRQTIAMRSNFIGDYSNAGLTDPRVTP